VIGWVVVETMRSNPLNAGIGVLIMLAGMPVYFVWRRLFSAART
jgi:basic amino acid/polyamine antiporter, APA family